MKNFKLKFSRISRLLSKHKRSSQSSEVTFPAFSAVTRREFIRPPMPVQSAAKPTVPPPIDSYATEVMEDEGREDDGGAGVNVEGEDDFALEPEAEFDGDEEPEDAPEPFPVELAYNHRSKVPVCRLYVALSDNEHRIKALRTPFGEEFTQIVRVMFVPPSTKNGMFPSNWSSHIYITKDKPFELQLRCPTFMRDLGALTSDQFHFARTFSTTSLMLWCDAWMNQDRKSPSSEEDCDDLRMLIVGPPDRSVDVKSVFDCCVSTFTDTLTQNFPDWLGKLNLVHTYWTNCLPANAIPEMPNV